MKFFTKPSWCPLLYLAYLYGNISMHACIPRNTCRAFSGKCHGKPLIHSPAPLIGAKNTDIIEMTKLDQTKNRSIGTKYLKVSLFDWSTICWVGCELHQWCSITASQRLPSAKWTLVNSTSRLRGLPSVLFYNSQGKFVSNTGQELWVSYQILLTSNSPGCISVCLMNFHIR